MDKKDEVNEEVHYSDVKRYQNDFRKDSQTDVENKDAVHIKTTQINVENKSISKIKKDLMVLFY